MAKIYYKEDADMSLLNGKRVGIVGYGSQGHAHALNLHDNGVDVVVALHAGSTSRAKAEMRDSALSRSPKPRQRATSS